MEHKVKRALSCFLNEDDTLVFEIFFENFDLGLFQKEFSLSTNDPMYHVYPILEKNLELIKEALPKEVEINWNFNSFSYFVETYEN